MTSLIVISLEFRSDTNGCVIKGSGMFCIFNDLRNIELNFVFTKILYSKPKKKRHPFFIIFIIIFIHRE